MFVKKKHKWIYYFIFFKNLYESDTI
jgi:hypothetical protein